MRLKEFLLLSEAAAFDKSFESFVFSKLRSQFSDLSEVEDLFDYAYLEDLTVDAMAATLKDQTKSARKPLSKAEMLKKAKDVAKAQTEFLLDNNHMDEKLDDDEAKELLPKLEKFAEEWSGKIAQAIVDYLELLDESLNEAKAAVKINISKGADSLKYKNKTWKQSTDWVERREKRLFYECDNQFLVITLKIGNTATAQVQDDEGEEVSFENVVFDGDNIWNLVPFTNTGLWKKTK